MSKPGNITVALAKNAAIERATKLTGKTEGQLLARFIGKGVPFTIENLNALSDAIELQEKLSIEPTKTIRLPNRATRRAARRGKP